MIKFIQTHFFHPSTFLLSTKQKWEKIKSFLFSHFFILPPFFIISFFHYSKQTDLNKSQRENACIPLTISWQDFAFFFFFSTYWYPHLFSLHGNLFPYSSICGPPYSAQTIFIYNQGRVGLYVWVKSHIE